MKNKVTIFSILCGLIVSLSVSAANISQYTAMQDTISLWPNGTPNGDADQEARIYVFLPEKAMATGRAVIACPGGSYYGCLPELEGNNWAPFFNKQGIALIVLKYRLPRKKKEVPLSDAYEAIRVVKDSADSWHINKKDIGIMGSSAGGHLASTIATHAPAESLPAFQILFYPVISMTDGLTHADSRTNLLGTSPTQADIDLYSNEKQVTESTPRAFIVFADDDYTVTPKNGTQYYQALRDKNIPASLFIYPKGSHGFGATKEINFRDQLENNLILWLNDFGEEYVHGMPETLSIEGGAVTETGGQPLAMKKDGGIFEIYTSLTAGTYSFDDTRLSSGGTITEDGIYRIRVNYNTDPITVEQQKINRVYAWYAWGQLDLFDLSYVGNSTFKVENKTWTPTSDNRFRIRMQVGGANTIETYGPKDGENFVLIGNGQWGAGNDYNYGVDKSKYFKTGVPFNITVNLSPATGYSVTVEEYTASSILSPGSAAENVIISPNPVTNNFDIISSQAGFSVEVISVSGDVVLRDSTESDALTVSGINFSSGVYLVKVTRDNQVISTKRIIKS
jgi:acetyl esterase/lipase